MYSFLYWTHQTTEPKGHKPERLSSLDRVTSIYWRMTMNYLALFSQISALTLAASSNRADALAASAVFAVLCVVAVFVRDIRAPRRFLR